MWTWREDSANDGRVPATPRTSRFAFLAIISAFVLTRLGDKMLLSTVPLASDHPWNGVGLDSTMGTVCADTVAVRIGTLLRRSLPSPLRPNIATVLVVMFGF